MIPDQANLAQLNIARMRWAAADPRMAGFVGNIDRMNALAARAPGFVWRCEDKADIFPDDSRMTWTLSVWETAEALSDFAFRTVHARFHARRHDWFEQPLDRPYLIMWHVAPDHRPSTDEALEKLARMEREGPSDQVFGWEVFQDLKGARPISRDMARLGTG